MYLLSGEPLPYTTFSARQPDNANGQEGCLERVDLLMNDIPCSTGRPLTCQHPKPGRCSKGLSRTPPESGIRCYRRSIRG